MHRISVCRTTHAARRFELTLCRRAIIESHMGSKDLRAPSLASLSPTIAVCGAPARKDFRHNLNAVNRRGATDSRGYDYLLGCCLLV